MRVTLPHPLELACFDVDEPAATQRLAPVCGTCPLPEAADASGRTSRALKRSASSASPGPAPELARELAQGCF